jgi:hypothetical protein
MSIKPILSKRPGPNTIAEWSKNYNTLSMPSTLGEGKLLVLYLKKSG